MTSASRTSLPQPGRAQDPEVPIRSALPPIVQLSLGIWAGTAAGFAWTEFLLPDTLVIVGIVCALSSAMALALLRRICMLPFGRKRTVAHLACMLSLGLALGGMCGCAGALAYRMQVSRVDGVSGSLKFRAVDDARETRFGGSVVCRLADVDGRRVLFGPKITVWPPDAEMRYGAVFTCEGIISGDDGSGTARSRGIAGSISAFEVLEMPDEGPSAFIVKLRNTVIDTIREADTPDGEALSDACAVLEALVCGFRKDLFAGDIYDAFKMAGVGHLVAVSGAHLAVMFASLSYGIRLTRIPKRAASVLEFAGLASYLVFSAIQISALRAAVMVGLSLTAAVSGRRPAVLNALGFCIIAVCVLSPSDALSASFILSASSTLGIVLFCGLCSAWVKTIAPIFPKIVLEPVSLTVSASAVSMPFSIALFSQCSLINLASNIVCAVLFAPVCTFGLVCACICCVAPTLGLTLLRAGIAASGVLCEVVKWMAGIPYACIAATMTIPAALLGTIIFGFLLWLAWPRPSVQGMRALGALSLGFAVAVFIAAIPEDRVVMFDVGQGDSILIQSGGRSLLIDTGDEETLLKQALARSRIVRLDGVVITHPDSDHCACLEALSKLVVFDTVYVAHEMLSCPCEKCTGLRKRCEVLKIRLIGLSLHDELRFGNMTCTVLWPSAFTEAGGNADSLSLLCSYGSVSTGESAYRMLFTGDAEAPELEAMISMSEVGDIDLIKVGHHGSAGSLTTTTLDVLKPEIALISVGEGNRYGHPTEETLILLQEASSRVYRTDLSGDISVIFSGRGVEVSCER